MHLACATVDGFVYSESDPAIDLMQQFLLNVPKILMIAREVPFLLPSFVDILLFF